MATSPISLGLATPSVITNLVSDQIEVASDWANLSLTNATTHLNTLAGLTFNVSYEVPEIVSVTGPSVNPTKPGPPEVADIEIAPVAFTSLLPVVPTFDLITHTPPEYTEKDYGISIPAAPTVLWPSFTKEAPVTPDRLIPNVPVTEIPPVPTIADIVIPPPPSYDSPEFTAEVPIADLTLPTVSFDWGESVYNSDLKTKLGDLLYDNLVSGGSGLDETTEAAIYTRATGRMEEEEQKLIDEVSDNVAQRGFDIPPGALITLAMEAENKILRSKTDLNKDILIQQSNLAQVNTHFIITQSANLENILISYHNNVQARTLDAAKYTIATTVQMHQLKLENYKARLDAYQILAQVYGIRVQAEIAKAEFYKAQIEATKVSVEVQNLYLKAYLGQLEGVKATLETYRLQMEGAHLAASIDKLKLDGYATEVNAYGVKVTAATQRYEGYKAELSGESIKASMRQIDVNSFSAQSSAYHVKNQAEVARSETILNGVRIEAAVYEQAIKKYNADVSKSVSEAEVKARLAGLDVAVYSAEATTYVNELNASVDLFRGRIAEMQVNSDLSVKSADLAIRAALGEYELAVEIAKGVSSVSGQLAAAAAGAVNASLHASSSESRADNVGRNTSTSSSYSASESDAFIEEHIYSYSN
jgi:hypothetical protein